jgi:GNAT superfamily N-acetyltransferase
MIHYRWMGPDDAFAICHPLAQAHFQELALHKDHYRKPDLDLEQYRAYEKTGALHILVATDGDQPIGYIVLLLHRNKHYRSILMASEDTYYIKPEYRGHRIGSEMFSLAERKMAEFGAMMMSFKTRTYNGHDNGNFLRHRGYEQGDTIYTKILRRKG